MAIDCLLSFNEKKNIILCKFSKRICSISESAPLIDLLDLTASQEKVLQEDISTLWSDNSFQAQSPNANSVQAQAPIANSVQARAPTANSFQSRAPTANSFQAQAPTANSFQSRAPTANSFQAQAPTANSFQYRAPTANSFQAQAPTANSVQAQAPTANSFQAHAPVMPVTQYPQFNLNYDLFQETHQQSNRPIYYFQNSTVNFFGSGGL